MTRRNWMAFAAMFVAGLFLVGCGGGGDDGMAGAMGPPGDSPTAEEVAEAILADEDAVDMLTGPAGDAGADAGVQDVVDTLAMTPAERIMAAMGGTAPTGSEADVAKTQADTIAALKGLSATPVWYDAQKIINLAAGDTVTGAVRLIHGDVGAELANLTTVANPGPDRELDDAPGGGGTFFNINRLLTGLNARRVSSEALNAGPGLSGLPQMSTEMAQFDAYFDAIYDSRIDNPAFDADQDDGSFDPTGASAASKLRSSTDMVEWEDVEAAFRDAVTYWPYDINFLLNNYFDSGDTEDDGGLFGDLLDMYRVPGTSGLTAEYDTNGDGTPDFTHAEMEAVLGRTVDNIATPMSVSGARSLSGNISDIPVAINAEVTVMEFAAISKFLLTGLIMSVDYEVMQQSDPSSMAGDSDDNYPGGHGTGDHVDRNHIDTLTLVPVVDVDGVSLVKYTIDSALWNNPDGTINKDGHYRLEAYGAWLEDSYFGVHMYSAVTDYGEGTLVPATRKTSTAVHFRGGHPASLAGLNESAMWTGAMVGHDKKSKAADTRVQGNAMLNARITADTLANPGVGGVAVMDVMFDNITDAAGMDAARNRVVVGAAWSLRTARTTA